VSSSNVKKPWPQPAGTKTYAGTVQGDLELRNSARRLRAEAWDAGAARWDEAYLLLVGLGEGDAAPAPERGAALPEVGDDVVEGAAHARDELAEGRAVEAAQRVLLG